MNAKSWIATAAFLALLAPVVSAQQPAAGDDWKQGRLVDIRTDHLSLKPYLTEEMWYDSNVYLSKNNVKNDVVFVTRPGFDLEYDSTESGTKAKVGYYFRNLNYVDITDLNENENHVVLSLDQKVGQFTFNVYGKYDQQKTIVDYQAAPIQGYTVLNAGLKAVYDFNTFDGEVGAEYKKYTYDQAIYEPYDYSEIHAWLGIAYHLWSKSDLLGEVGYGRDTYKQDVHNSSTWYEILAGVKGRPTTKIGVQVKTGVRVEKYTEDNSAFSSDFTGWIIRGAATYDASERDRLTLEVLREPVPSLFSNYYVTNRVALNYDHAFSNRFRAGGGLFYEYVTESGDLDNYSRVGFNVRGAYDILEWLSVEARYEYQSKDGDLSQYNYNVSRLMLALTGRF
jgi:hypothetical protein